MKWNHVKKGGWDWNVLYFSLVGVIGEYSLICGYDFTTNDNEMSFNVVDRDNHNITPNF